MVGHPNSNMPTSPVWMQTCCQVRREAASLPFTSGIIKGTVWELNYFLRSLTQASSITDLHICWRGVLAHEGNKVDGRDMVLSPFVDELKAMLQFISGLKRVVFFWRGIHSDCQQSAETLLSKVKAKLSAEESYSHLEITVRRDSEWN